MRLVVISDTHHKHTKVKVPKGDVLIHCGDFMGSSLNEKHFYDFLTWFGGQPHKHKLLVPGNHDGILERNAYQAYFHHISNLNINLMLLNTIVIDGVSFSGYCYTKPFNNWFFQEDKDYARWIRPCDVLITHGPPYGVNDKNTNGSHCGSKYLSEWVAKNKPKYHFHGHIHETYGYTNNNGTHTYCCAIMNENYKPVNKPVVIQI